MQHKLFILLNLEFLPFSFDDFQHLAYVVFVGDRPITLFPFDGETDGSGGTSVWLTEWLIYA